MPIKITKLPKKLTIWIKGYTQMTPKNELQLLN